MIVFKILGLGMIVLSSAAIGFLKSKSLLSRCKKLELIYDGAQLLYEHVNQGGAELQQAIENSFAKCDFLHINYETNYCDDLDFTKEDKTLINQFFNGLGDSVKSVECERINAFKLKIKTQLNDAKDNCAQKCKIYQTLGVCAGLVIGILLI